VPSSDPKGRNGFRDSPRSHQPCGLGALWDRNDERPEGRRRVVVLVAGRPQVISPKTALGGWEVVLWRSDGPSRGSVLGVRLAAGPHA
jgi:hypothetical protein